MPRANRYIIPGHIYHLTHRCHDRAFLLKFAKDRTGYRRRMLQALKKYRVSILGYCITSNHVHLIIWGEDPAEISHFMQEVAGAVARDFNRRKERSGGYWEGRYQATMIEGGVYLEHCRVYVDLNMFRCGVVRHPRDWDWCGYAEIMGTKHRNRVLDVAKILELMGGADLGDLRKHYEGLVEERIAKDEVARQPQWTESLAVGSQAFLEDLQLKIRNRAETQIRSDSGGHWVLRESAIGESYATLLGPKK